MDFSTISREQDSRGAGVRPSCGPMAGRASALASGAPCAAPLSAAAGALMPLLLAGLDTLAQGVALVDQEFRVAYANASARATLARCGWLVVGGQLRCARPADQALWSQALHKVCGSERRELIELCAGDAPTFAALVPAPGPGRCWAFVTFGRDELCGALELQLFASRHGLTYAECEVLRKLSLGLKATEIAQAHGVAISTVLTQVAAVRAKTLCSSVRQLLSRLSRLPQLRSALASRELEAA
jgi:DNA-binding CsgD family transcriptional regulator